MAIKAFNRKDFDTGIKAIENMRTTMKNNENVGILDVIENIGHLLTDARDCIFYEKKTRHCLRVRD